MKTKRSPDDVWRDMLVDGKEPVTRMRRIFRHLPSEPRCKLCSNPFGGVGGALFGLAGFRPSRKNPNVCGRCSEALPPGGIEIDVAVLFSDLRGSTTLGERQAPTDFAHLLNRFYATAANVLITHDGIVDKLIGDEIMGLFIPGIAGPAYRDRAVDAGLALRDALAAEGLEAGTAVNAGISYVGNVGDAHVVDFTALGDAVNTAARLQAEAGAGELIVLAELAADRFPAAESRTVTVRGRTEPVDVLVLRA